MTSDFPSRYRCAPNFETLTDGTATIVPIREADKFSIRQWRNGQTFHLRQVGQLTDEDQVRYFANVVGPSMSEPAPSQVLVSYLVEGVCRGYGGLVHIDWNNRRAELSFLLATDVSEVEFAEAWVRYLLLIEQLAFGQLGLHKIYTYAYDVRPHLYPAIERAGLVEEARLRRHMVFDGQAVDVVIHAKVAS